MNAQHYSIYDRTEHNRAWRNVSVASMSEATRLNLARGKSGSSFGFWLADGLFAVGYSQVDGPIVFLRTNVFRLHDLAWTTEYPTSKGHRPIATAECWFDTDKREWMWAFDDKEPQLDCELQYLSILTKLSVQPGGIPDIALESQVS